MRMQFRCCECCRTIDVPVDDEKVKEEDYFSSDTKLIELALPTLHLNGWDFILGRCYCGKHMEIGELALKEYKKSEYQKNV